MSEDEVKEAIEKCKLPLRLIDFIVIAFFTLFFIGLICLGILAYNNPNFQNFTEMLCFLSFCMLFGIYLIWQFSHEKELIIYLNTLSIAKKNDVLEKLTSDPDVKFVDRKDNYYCIAMYSDDRWGNYTVTIIYNESAYGINSIWGSGRTARLSGDISEEIIDKIKKVEAEL